MKMVSAVSNLLLTKKNQKNNLYPAADSRRSDAASELKLNDEWISLDRFAFNLAAFSSTEKYFYFHGLRIHWHTRMPFIRVNEIDRCNSKHLNYVAWARDKQQRKRWFAHSFSQAISVWADHRRSIILRLVKWKMCVTETEQTLADCSFHTSISIGVSEKCFFFLLFLVRESAKFKPFLFIWMYTIYTHTYLTIFVKQKYSGGWKIEIEKLTKKNQQANKQRWFQHNILVWY